jgi:hypothetical protein
LGVQKQPVYFPLSVMILKNTELLKNHFEGLFHISDKQILEMRDQRLKNQILQNYKFLWYLLFSNMK